MKLIIQNNSKEYVVIRLNQEECLRIEGLAQYVCDINALSNIVDITVVPSYVSYMYDNEYHLAISLDATCYVSGESTIAIDRKSQIFQNAIYYEYFAISSRECSFDDLLYTVTNCDQIMREYKQRSKSKGSGITFQLCMNLIDTLLIGGAISGTLWILFNYKVAFLFLLGLYCFITAVQLFNTRLHRSKIRFLNWAKDDFSEDDLRYFIKQIKSFCK